MQHRAFDSAFASTKVQLCGVDISKHGIRVAAKRDALGHYAVASSADLPLADRRVDALLTHFSPVFVDAFARVLRPNGLLLVGSPGPEHLFGLKQLIYDDPQRHSSPATFDDDAQFMLMKTERIRYQLSLNSSRDIHNLLAMTPFFWTADEATQRRVASLATLETSIDVIVDVYQRSP